MAQEQETVNVAVTADDVFAALEIIQGGGSVDWLSLEGVNVMLVPAEVAGVEVGPEGV